MSLGYWETLVSTNVDGTAITAAARTSMLLGTAHGLYTLPANKLAHVGDVLHLHAMGRISCVITTPGTARFDLAVGATPIFDSLAMNLNTVAKTNVQWVLDIYGTVRAIGTTCNIMWGGSWKSEAVVGSPLPTAGGIGQLTVPVNTAPVVGGNINSTINNLLDFFFTQTVATGSCQLHQYHLSLKTSTGF